MGHTGAPLLLASHGVWPVESPEAGRGEVWGRVNELVLVTQ